MSVRKVLVPLLAGGVFMSGWILGGTGGVGAQPAPPGLPHFKCYPIVEGGTDPPHIVQLRDQFGVETGPVEIASFLCTPTRKKIIDGPPAEPPSGVRDHLKCYAFFGQLVPPKTSLHNQLGTEDPVTTAPARFVCVPTTKRVPT